MEHFQVPNQSPEIWAESCQLYSFNQSMFYMYIVCIVALSAMLNTCICFFRFIHWHLLDSLSMSGLSMGNRIKWCLSFVLFLFLLGIPKMAVTHHHYIVSTVFLCVPMRMTDLMDDCGVPKSRECPCSDKPQKYRSVGLCLPSGNLLHSYWSHGRNSWFTH